MAYDPYAEHRIPALTREALDNYKRNRWDPGLFLTAVLSNNLKESFGCADELNTEAMPAIVSFVYCKLPHESQGSPEKVKTWLAGRRK